MKVSELRELVAGMDSDGEVWLMMYDGCCSDTITLEVIDWDKGSKRDAHIYIKAVPGYETCRKATVTKEASKK